MEITARLIGYKKIRYTPSHEEIGSIGTVLFMWSYLSTRQVENSEKNLKSRGFAISLTSQVAQSRGYVFPYLVQ